MVPSSITDDYCVVLNVGPTATPEQIKKSYKRLAWELHPDRNAKVDATKAFQLLVQAYETLKDESKRKAYDLKYPFNTHRPRPSSTSTPHPEASNEAAQIDAFQKSKQVRGVRWRIRVNAFDSSIFELQRGIRRLEQEIKNLDSIIAAEAVTEARKNSWTTWLLSPITKKREETEEEKANIDRKRQERRIEKDLKERWLASKKTDLKGKETLSRKEKEEVNAADLNDDEKIRVIKARICARESRERQEKEKAERDRQAKIRKQQLQEQWEKREREAAAAAEQSRKEEDDARKSREKALVTPTHHHQQPAATTAGGRKYKVIPHAPSAMTFGLICYDAPAVR
ncbi:hypothetical protein MMC09_004145 [Bachmanniomyces sp. S44760]|nr:hypothetical protein [Bachmanniomyces sp. S44760]